MSGKLLKRNHTLDILRAFAALAVVLFHLNEPIAHIDNWYRNIVKLGWLGVPVFFVISGYCIMMSAFKTKKFNYFISKRFFRIFPPYWVSLLLIILIAILQKIVTGFNSISSIPKNLIEIGANLALLTKPFSNIETINWVYWSLTYEWFFYLLIGIVMLSLPIRFWITALSIITLISIYIDNSDYNILFFFHHWPTFSLGLAAYTFHFDNTNKRLFYFFTLVILSMYGIVNHFVLVNQVEYGIASLLTFIILLISPYLQVSKNILTSLGDYSYGVYLLHVPIGIYIMGRLKTKDIQENIFLNILYDLIIYLICCSAAKLFYQFIELPSMKLGNKPLIISSDNQTSSIDTKNH
ncbi:acyltransferase family protein [Pedobacter glucosidilyticus]|uniref:acyltransferase family protein n=1 Tax=Pedobacter glucosidilyticus TaxID=1122941 RepID=UPI0026EE16E1|nr:acyltransferase [Pedobacter glucosidilyticus]